jgi:hypothetical protein
LRFEGDVKDVRVWIYDKKMEYYWCFFNWK